MSELPHPNVARVLAAADQAGLSIAVRRFPQETRTAEAAAQAIGCEVAQIVKSLVFVADDEPVLVLVAGSDRVDVARLGSALGAARVRRATGDEARAATGFAIGGVAPLGHPRPLRVVMDAALLGHAEVWAAAGLPDAVFAIDPARLASAARAHIADVAEDGARVERPSGDRRGDLDD